MSKWTEEQLLAINSEGQGCDRAGLQGEGSA